MGGTVSTGRDNDELIDNLIDGDYITTKQSENAFRAVDRGHYLLPDHRSSAYADAAWRSDNIHMSAPGIYAKVVEALDLKYGQSFLNMGSGTGYLSTIVGLIIGCASSSRNHGVEHHSDVVEYAKKRLGEFIKTCPSFDEHEFCAPRFLHGNCLRLSATGRKYDRIYCGAQCDLESLAYIKNLMTDDAIAIVPCEAQLLKIEGKGGGQFTTRNLMAVSFATLYPPTKDDDDIEFPDLEAQTLKMLCRIAIRTVVRKNIHVWKGELDVRRKPRQTDGLPERITHRILNVTASDSENADSGDDEDVAEAAEPAEPEPPPSASAASCSDPAEGADSGVGLGTSCSSGAPTDDPSEEVNVVEVDDVEVDHVEVDHVEVDHVEVDHVEVDHVEVDHVEVDHVEVDESEVEASLPSDPLVSRMMASEHELQQLTDTQSSDSPKRQRDEDDTGEPSSTPGLKRRLLSCCGYGTQSQAHAATNAADVVSDAADMASDAADVASDAADGAGPSSARARQPTPPPRERRSAAPTNPGNNNDDSDMELDDEMDPLFHPLVALRTRRERLLGLIYEPYVLPRQPNAEEERERLHNRAKARLYHSSFAEAMEERMGSLPIPTALKNYLLFYRNNLE